ncbi:MAG: phosphopantetheine-binding protein [Acidobacteriota bacterium]
MDTSHRQELEARIKHMIVDRLKLEIEPDSIDSAEPLFGDEGLGLDSIDALELVLGIERELGVAIDDEEMGSEAMASVQALADFVEERRGDG